MYGKIRRAVLVAAMLVGLAWVAQVPAAAAQSPVAQGVSVKPMGGSGCVVDRLMIPPSAIYNGGLAWCVSLTGGTKVRVKILCDKPFGGTHYVYGPWRSTAYTHSKANCGGMLARTVDYQLS